MPAHHICQHFMPQTFDGLISLTSKMGRKRQNCKPQGSQKKILQNLLQCLSESILSGNTKRGDI
jgi:hypothetical protein